MIRRRWTVVFVDRNNLRHVQSRHWSRRRARMLASYRAFLLAERRAHPADDGYGYITIEDRKGES